jgi:uncharacterized membrane protein
MSRLLAKHWALALVVSVALNVMFGGMALARCVRGQPLRPGGMFPQPLHGLRRDLDPTVHPALDRVDRAHAAQIEARMRAVSDARARAMAALAAEDLDPVEARTALADFRTKVGEAHDEIHESLLELAASLPPEQRRALGEAWGRAGYRRGPGPGAGRAMGRGHGPRHRAGPRGPQGEAGSGASASAPADDAPASSSGAVSQETTATPTITSQRVP